MSTRPPFLLPLLLASSFHTVSFADDPRTYELNASDVARTSLRYRVVESEAPRGPREIEEQTVQTYSLRHVQYFALADQLAYAGIQVPYRQIEQDFRNSRRRGDDQSGLGDPMLSFGMGVYRMPALSWEELKRYNRDGFSSGCQLLVSLPLGSYDSRRGSNPGSNRWMVIPECQLGYTQGRWLVEGFASMNWFSDNDDYRGGTFSQDPLYNFKLSTSYGSMRDYWLAVSAEYHHGGATTRLGRADNNGENDWDGEVALYYNFGGGNSMKLFAEWPLSNSAGTSKSRNFSVVMSHTWR